MDNPVSANWKEIAHYCMLLNIVLFLCILIFLRIIKHIKSLYDIEVSKRRILGRAIEMSIIVMEQQQDKMNTRKISYEEMRG